MFNVCVSFCLKISKNWDSKLCSLESVFCRDGKEKLMLMVCLTVCTSITLRDILQGINEIAYVQETKYGEVNLDYVLGIGGFNLER